jgi:hypothetical protein
MTFDLPGKLTEVREFCLIHKSFQCTVNDVFIVSNVEDWLGSNDITYDYAIKTVDDGFFNRVRISLKIPNVIQALQFKLRWL